MKFLPSEDFDLEVPFTAAEVRNRMRSLVSAPTWNPAALPALFEGEVRRSSFSITWPLVGRDQFARLVIEGNIFDRDNGSRLIGEVSLHPMMQALVVFVLAASVLSVLSALFTGRRGEPIDFAIGTVAIAITAFGEWFLRKSVRDVRIVFEGFFSSEDKDNGSRGGT